MALDLMKETAEWDEKSTKLSDEDNKIKFPDNYNILQSLPEVKPFVLLSRRGWCACAVPVRYDQIPFRDIEMRISSAA
ncbi:MAG: hypothetical protein EZS28_056591, partial [Streblomastix strix]